MPLVADPRPQREGRRLGGGQAVGEVLAHDTHALDVRGRVEAQAAGRAHGTKEPVTALPRAQQLRAHPRALAQLPDPEDSVAVHEQTIQHLNKLLTTIQTTATVPYMDNIRTEGGQMKGLNAVAAALLVVGGLNWGLVALAEFDLVAWIFGEEFGTTNAASRIVYGLVGLAAIYAIGALLAQRRTADTRGPATAQR